MGGASGIDLRRPFRLSAVSSLSILHDLDVPELIGEDLAAYERLAIALARDPERLRQIRAKVESNRLTTPLFDTEPPLPRA